MAQKLEVLKLQFLVMRGMHKMTLAEEKIELKKMEISFNIRKLAVKLLEYDEEKKKVQESIDKLEESLKNLNNPETEDK